MADIDVETAYEDGLPTLRTWLIVLGAALLYSVFAQWPDWSEQDWGLRVWGGITTGIGTLALWLTVRSFPTRDKLFRLPVVFMIFFWLFHFGLALIVSIAPAFIQNPLLPTAWFNVPETVIALKLCALAMVCLALGSTYAPGTVRNPDEATLLPGRPAVFWVGVVVLIVGVALFGKWVMASGGLGLFTKSYHEILATVGEDGGSSFPFAVYLYSVGALLVLTGIRREKWVWFMVPFTLAMGVLAAIGLRSEAMIPLLLSAVVLARRGIVFPRWALVTAVLVVLIAIPFIKVMRQSGIGAGLSLEQQYGLVDGIAEMGSSLRPVVASVQYVGPVWDLMYGGSYMLPVERQIGRFIPIPSLRGNLDTDPRNLNVRINRDVGAIGFSCVAEAYGNFGNLGIPLVMLVIGFLLGVLDRRAFDHQGIALLALVALPMLNTVRNAFIHVPGQMLLGLVILWTITMVHRALTPDGDPAPATEAPAAAEV